MMPFINKQEASFKHPKPYVTVRQYPLYFGGLACTLAVFGSHPFDTVKVQMQVLNSTNMRQTIYNIYKTNKLGGFYYGLTASLLRQFLYSLSRFAVYDYMKVSPIFVTRNSDGTWPTLKLYQKVSLGAFSGMIGGFFGAPGDIINVRMQADALAPVSARRGYNNAFHGIYKITKTEGFTTLWRGCVPLLIRTGIVTSAQIASYDHIKENLMKYLNFKDSPNTHFTSSFLASLVAVLVSMPFDVIKTKIQHASPNMYKGPINCLFKSIKSNGFFSLWKGALPAYIRLGPQTILAFMILEQQKRIYRMFYKIGEYAN